MADFTVRIEMHNAGLHEYNLLHAAMDRQGFRRFIISGDGAKFELPTAEYNLTNSALTADLALSIARSVRSNPDPWVLVSQSTTRAWSTKRSP